MHNPTSLLVTLTAALAALPEAQAAIYTKNSPVLQVNARNYDKLIAKSNYTSVSLPSFLFSTRHLHTLDR
jgi:protein disulfide-isomerase A6